MSSQNGHGSNKRKDFKKTGTWWKEVKSDALNRLGRGRGVCAVAVASDDLCCKSY